MPETARRARKKTHQAKIWFFFSPPEKENDVQGGKQRQAREAKDEKVIFPPLHFVISFLVIYIQIQRQAKYLPHTAIRSSLAA